MLAAAPEFSGDLLVNLWNHGPELRPALARVLASTLPTERARERRRFLVVAARLLGCPELSTYAIARRLHARMGELLVCFPGYIDVALFDGALSAALLVDGLELPVERTVRNALDP